MEKTIYYKNNDVTVAWKPEQCIHSTICWKGLLDVFNPQKRPWVNMEGATTEMIIEQVRKCPSGALSYFLNSEINETAAEDVKVVAESAHIMQIEVTPNGPYRINTECVIIHSNGTKETKKGAVTLCRCGASGNKPYCDGSHIKTEFQG